MQRFLCIPTIVLVVSCGPSLGQLNTAAHEPLGMQYDAPVSADLRWRLISSAENGSAAHITGAWIAAMIPFGLIDSFQVPTHGDAHRSGNVEFQVANPGVANSITRVNVWIHFSRP